jgi:hypothetical protein
LENGESEEVSLEIQYEVPDIESVEQPSDFSVRNMFTWQDPSDTAVAGNTLDVGVMKAGVKRDCLLLFNAPPEPTEHSLSLIIKYFLQSDPKTEVVKRALIDVPVIQPLQTTFDIFPQLASQSGMPNIFADEEEPLRVSQTWRLVSSISRIGSDLLELKRIQVIGECNVDNVSVDIIDGSSSIDDISRNVASCYVNVVLDTLSHHTETTLTLKRPIDTEANLLLHLNLSITWRRQSTTQKYEWNELIVPIPELSFFPFAPRILAGN